MDFTQADLEKKEQIEQLNGRDVLRVEVIVVPERFYFRVSAAALYLGISANNLRKYTDLGLIQPKRLPGGDRIYCREWLDDFIHNLPDGVKPWQG
jgi:hypothetical protein